MNYTAVDLFSSSLATLAFAFLLLPPAYLFARWTNLLQMRTRSWPEQFLWVLSLSIPFSLFLSSVLGRWLPPYLLTAGFAVAAVYALVLVLPALWRHRVAMQGELRARAPVLVALLGFAVYVLLMASSLQIHGRLYESVNYTDWSVRLPLVNSAMRNGVPPGNPFFTLNLEPQPARYYYYWYVLCAQVGRPLHLSARACLTGSAVWSGFALVSVLFLLLRHTRNVHPIPPRRYLTPLLLCCVMGIDIIPAFAGYFVRPPVIYPEMEWWLDDRIPSFLGAVLFAPHHIGGIVCCTLAFLVLFVSRETLHTAPHALPPPRWKTTTIAAVTAAICFAACAGDSTYVAFCFFFAGVLYAADLVRKKRWSDLATLCGAGLLAVLLTVPFLREITAPAPWLPSTHQGFLRFALRNTNEYKHFAGVYLERTHGRVQHLLRIATTAFLLPAQFGFFLVPLGLQAHKDFHRLRRGESLSDGERLLWAIFLGAAFPAFFLSSEPQGVNDLGRHAGLILRLVLVVWATAWVEPLAAWFRGRKAVAPPLRWAAYAAAALFALGLLTQFWQIASDRLLLPLLARHDRLVAQPPVSADNDLGARFLQIRRGLDLVERQLPPGAVVQSNMGNRFQMLAMLYSSHPFAAGDLSCESAFGGDTRRCAPRVAQLQDLFGVTSDVHDLQPFYGDHSLGGLETTTVARFEQTCRDQQIAAILVQDNDFVWKMPDSWVWKLTPVYAASKVRIFACPAALHVASAAMPGRNN